MTKSESNSLPRSPELLSTDRSAVLVVDVQQKLIELVPNYARLIWNIRRIIDGAKLLGVPILATEQYPQGLGSTVSELADRLGPIPAKLTFSCVGCVETVAKLQEMGCTQVVIAGIEAHVCVLQTALDLLSAGYRVYLVVDAVGARHDIDYATALRRLEACGASLVTTEMTLFEWCRVAGTAHFKQISALVRESPPGE